MGALPVTAGEKDRQRGFTFEWVLVELDNTVLTLHMVGDGTAPGCTLVSVFFRRKASIDKGTGCLLEARHLRTPSSAFLFTCFALQIPRAPARVMPSTAPVKRLAPRPEKPSGSGIVVSPVNQPNTASASGSSPRGQKRARPLSSCASCRR